MDDLERRFRYHKPNDQTVETIASYREQFLALARSINKLVPEGREKSLAITALEEAQMWTNAALARQ